MKKKKKKKLYIELLIGHKTTANITQTRSGHLKADEWLQLRSKIEIRGTKGRRKKGRTYVNVAG